MTVRRETQPRVALVTDWMTSFGGENRVLYELAKLYPEAPIYTTIYRPEELPMFRDRDVRTSFLDRGFLGWLGRKKFQMFLPLMPLAFESFDFSDYDLVITSNHSCSKGIITNTGTLHIAYCHSPMRYAWENSHRYLRENTPRGVPFMRGYVQRMIHRLRLWDRLAADRVDAFVANSCYISRQIAKFYRRPSTVIYPPVDTQRFAGSYTKQSYFLAGGRLVPNKRFDLIIEAFNTTGLPLKIFGKGPDRERLKAMAKPNIEFLGFLPEEDIPTLFGSARAFIVPQIEDFGIVTVEAMAAGTPVIGLGQGGTAELVLPGKTGVLMEEQTAACLIAALENFADSDYDPQEIANHAKQFDTSRFVQELSTYVQDTYTRWQESRGKGRVFDSHL